MKLFVKITPDQLFDILGEFNIFLTYPNNDQEAFSMLEDLIYENESIMSRILEDSLTNRWLYIESNSQNLTKNILKIIAVQYFLEQKDNADNELFISDELESQSDVNYIKLSCYHYLEQAIREYMLTMKFADSYISAPPDCNSKSLVLHRTGSNANSFSTVPFVSPFAIKISMWLGKHMPSIYRLLLKLRVFDKTVKGINSNDTIDATISSNYSNDSFVKLSGILKSSKFDFTGWYYEESDCDFGSLGMIVTKAFEYAKLKLASKIASDKYVVY